jgi:hypothetical protein
MTKPFSAVITSKGGESGKSTFTPKQVLPSIFNDDTLIMQDTSVLAVSLCVHFK